MPDNFNILDHSNLGTAAYKDVGNAADQVPSNKIPLGNMDLSMTSPIHYDDPTKVLSIDAAGATTPGAVTLNQVAAYAGAPGVAGTVWRNGSGAPSDATGADGDYYLNTAAGAGNGDVYKRATGSYSVVGNIKGLTGNTGSTGSTGSTGPSGTISVTAPITNSGSSTAAALAINAATGSLPGSMSAADKAKLDLMPGYVARSFSSAPARSLVSVAAAANGFQIDSARDAVACYSATITSTSNLSGGAAGYYVLEICPTNSAVAANWIEIARSGDGQSSALIVGLALTQIGGGGVIGYVPAGYYARVRTVNTTGTPTYLLNSAWELKL